MSFRSIPSHPDYEVDGNGTVRTKATGQIKKPWKHRRGYLLVQLYDAQGKKDNVRVHQAVASAFINNPGGKKQVDHIDGNYTNNKLSNLRWATNDENAAFRKTKNRMKKGLSKKEPEAKKKLDKPVKK